MSRIQIEKLNKSYFIGKDEYKVLKDLNISFESDEFVAIYGKSGCGKSTLMNVIGGLDEYQSGQILIDGNNIKDYSNKNMDYYRNHSVGFIFQEYNLLENLKVIDNVMLPLSISGKSSSECKKRALDLLEKVGLSDQKNKRARQLSGGQKQRVAIARALANDPDIILADEPTGALDSSTSKDILELLKSISKEGKLVVVITHSNEVIKYATRVITLENGAINDQVPPNTTEAKKAEITKNKKVALKLSKALKIARANLASKKFRTFLVALGLSLGITGSIVVTSISDEFVQETQDMFASFQTDETLVETYVYNQNYDSNSVEDMKAAEFYASNYEGFEGVIENKLITTTTSEIVYYEDESGNEIEELAEFSTAVIEVNYGDQNSYSVAYGEYPSSPNEVYFSGSIYDIEQFLYDHNSQISFSEEEHITIKAQKGNPTYDKVIDAIENEIIGSTFEVENVDGDIVEFKVVGATELIDYSYSGAFYKMPYELNKKFVDENGENWFGSYYIDFDTIDNAEKFIDDNASIDKQIDSITSDQYGIETGYADYRIEVSDNRAILKLVNSMITIIRNVFLGLIAVSFAVSVIMVNLIIYISTLERKIEIGTLRAIGAGKKDIRNIFVLEGIMIGVTGFMISLITSFIGVVFVNTIWYLINGGSTEFFYFGLSIPYLIIIAIAIILLMIISSLSPAIHASRQNPIDALREE